jgi:hypothetical protein
MQGGVMSAGEHMVQSMDLWYQMHWNADPTLGKVIGISIHSNTEGIESLVAPYFL